MRFVIFLLFFLCFSCETKNNKVVGTISKSGMVSSAQPLASEVGIDVLKKGGNVFDAAIAVHFALSVVYPSAGNLGGGGFVVYRLNNGEVGTLDFREKAPKLSFRNMYLKEENGELIVDDNKSKIGHLASGVPGSVDGMVTLHERFGSLGWSTLLDPAIKLAKNGFNITKKQSASLNKVKSSFQKVNDKPISLINESKWKENDILIQDDLGNTLSRIKTDKRNGFYSGITAELILKEMIDGGGIITKDDLENYSSIWREPVIGYYKNHKIISMGPPSSGGIALNQLLKGAEMLEVSNYDHNSSDYVHLLSEIESRVYADRATYLGDPDFYKVPQKELISSNYLSERFGTINHLKTPSNQIKEGDIDLIESEETTHFSIVDEFGNAISVTTTINGAYGSKVVVDGAGFLLNNEMDDFSVKPGHPNMFGLVGGAANEIAPEKRMLSAMTPTLVEKDGKLIMILGTPGGPTIITSVFQTILNVYDFKMSIQKAIDAPRFHHQWLPDQVILEPKKFNDQIIKKLQKKGYNIKEKEARIMGRVDAIHIDSDGKISTGADARGDDRAAVLR